MSAVTDLLVAAADYTQARRELSECREQAGYEAGYFCQRYSDAVDECEAAFKAAFAAAVREVIEGGAA